MAMTKRRLVRGVGWRGSDAPFIEPGDTDAKGGRSTDAVVITKK
jgi:hypothetical protein